MGFDVEGKRVLVTGASSGIGAALAQRLASRGAVLGVTARREAELGRTLAQCRQHSPASEMWLCDMAVPDEVDELAGNFLSAFGGIDLLVNNAGIPRRKHVLALDAATVEHVMRVNYFAPVQLTLGLLPALMQSRGRVVNVSSIAAPLSSPGEAAYDASKAALASFSEAMAMDLWFDGVRVMVVYPGVVDTPLFDVPDNDPLPASAPDRIPVSEMVDAIVEGLRTDAVDVFAPAWFRDVVIGKARNNAEFLAAAAQFARDGIIPKP